MKGIIFNIAEEFIIDNFGEDALDDILRSCELETKEPFVGPGTYPDSDLVKITTKLAQKLGISIHLVFSK